MAMTMAASPSGAQVLGDGGNPRIITGVATEDIIAGTLVVSNAATSAQAVGSSTGDYAPTDIEFLYVKDSVHCNGIALASVSSGTNAYLPVATRGTYILRSAGVISGGQNIVPFSGVSQAVTAESAVLTITSGTVSSTGTYPAQTVIGRSLTNSASGTNLYVLANLNL